MKNMVNVQAQLTAFIKDALAARTINDTSSFPLAMNVAMSAQHPLSRGDLSFRFYDLQCQNIGDISVEPAQIQPQNGRTSLQIGLEAVKISGYYAIDVKDKPDESGACVFGHHPYSGAPASPMPAGGDEGSELGPMVCPEPQEPVSPVKAGAHYRVLQSMPPGAALPESYYPHSPQLEGTWGDVAVAKNPPNIQSEDPYESFGQPSSKTMAMALGWQRLSGEDRSHIANLSHDEYQEYLAGMEQSTDVLWQGHCEAVVKGAVINLVVDNSDPCRAIRSQVELPTFDFDLDDSQWQGEAATVARERLSQIYFVRSLLHEQIGQCLAQAVNDATRRVRVG